MGLFSSKSKDSVVFHGHAGGHDTTKYIGDPNAEAEYLCQCGAAFAASGRSASDKAEAAFNNHVRNAK
ncbi:hypothetical protein F4561_002168 [Lipingzhangella halophila]|uniref:Uncharacterized protein n=1 Tax=Lipingzhangella halophila TaxID=1783352 RepID=A0A7W7W2D8_9ACTN|nr:hypothetical protein [Lipingzhangella halophila]MBB4931348.1 hypothetical protein [Lipingzhangella halophila]